MPYYIHTVLRHKVRRAVVRTNAYHVDYPLMYQSEDSLREAMRCTAKWLRRDGCDYDLIEHIVDTDERRVIARAKELIDLHTALES